MKLLRRFSPLALLVPLALTGCDTAGDDEFPLPTDVNHRASFVYMTGTLEAGETFTSDPVTQLSQPIINHPLYTPSDIASAQIRNGSVELQLDFPSGAENEIVIDEATLTLAAEGVGEQVVARGSDLTLATISTTAPQRRTLQIVNGNITEYLRQESFTGTLMLDVAGAGSEPYQFTVRFDVDATVTVDAAARAGAVTH